MRTPGNERGLGPESVRIGPATDGTLTVKVPSNCLTFPVDQAETPDVEPTNCTTDTCSDTPNELLPESNKLPLPADPSVVEAFGTQPEAAHWAKAGES